MTTAGATGAVRPPGRPVGRDAVVAAVLEAAGELFAEKGPASTSVRDIAARSGVNHGLVYRHFGTKEELVAAVLDHLSDQVADISDAGTSDAGTSDAGTSDAGTSDAGISDADTSDIGAGTDALDEAVERHWRVIAWAILDGYPVGRLQRRFPYVSRLVERALPHHPDEVSARLAAGHAVALELGWRLFEPFVRSATGIRDVPSLRLRQAINAAVAQMLDPDKGR